MAAVAGALGAGVGSVGLGWAALVGVPVGHALSYASRSRPGYVRKALLAGLAMVAFARFLTVAASGTVSSHQMRVPLGELFLWIQLLHSFDLPSRRDLLFTLLSSISLVLVAGVLATSSSFGFLLGAWALGSLLALILAHRSAQAELPRAWSGAARPSGTNPPAALQAVVAVVLVAVWTAVTYNLLPSDAMRPEGGLAARIGRTVPVPGTGQLSNPSLGPGAGTGSDASGRQGFGYFGFSSALDLASRGRPDATPVMKVRANRPDFWRGQSFDTWDGRRWTRSNDDAVPISPGRPLEVPPAAEDRPLQFLGRPLVQTYYLERPGPNLVYGAYRADQLFLPFDRAYALDDGTVRAGVELGPGAVYSVVSRRPPVTEAVLRGERALHGFSAVVARRPPPPELVARYTQLPDSTPLRVRALAADVTVGAATVYDKVRALEAWMGDHTRYTLDVPALPAGADAVEQFLFVDRRGFCEQIGTSLVVLLRSLGIPARLTVGFTPGERNPFTGMYQVRARDAHAWAEVFFPGIGWQAFDPTADVPLAGDAVLASSQVSMARYVADRLPGPADWAGGVVALAIAGPTVVVAVARALAARRRRRGRGWAATCIDRIEAVGARRGQPRRPHETAREYADSLVRAGVVAPDLGPVVRRLEADLFSAAGMGPGERASTEEALAGALRRPAPAAGPPSNYVDTG